MSQSQTRTQKALKKLKDFDLRRVTINLKTWNRTQVKYQFKSPEKKHHDYDCFRTIYPKNLTEIVLKIFHFFIKFLKSLIYLVRSPSSLARNA